METEKLQKIKQHLINLKQARNWVIKNLPDFLIAKSQQLEFDQPTLDFFNSKVLPAIEKEYESLEALGVDRNFSERLFILGGIVNDEELKQFN